MKNWLLKHKQVQKILTFFRQGTSPKALALSTTIGLLLGLFPILGTTTIIITLLGLLFRLNIPLMMALSYLMYPVQLILIIPFIRFGEWIADEQPIGLTLSALKAEFGASFFDAMQNLWSAHICGALGWVILAVPVGALLFSVLERSFHRRLRKEKSMTTSR